MLINCAVNNFITLLLYSGNFNYKFKLKITDLYMYDLHSMLT
jgi:hypothetical protein